MLNNREFSHGYRSHWSQLMPQKPQVVEDLLKSAHVQVERKTFIFSLKENPRGRLLRITESTGRHRNAIIIPATGLKDFLKVLEEMAKAMDEMPSQQADLAVPVDALKE